MRKRDLSTCKLCGRDIYRSVGDWYHSDTYDMRCEYGNNDRIATPISGCGSKYAALRVTGDTHRIWRDFTSRFLHDDNWKYTGWELMKRVEKWAPKHPTVKVTSCDDDLFASSIIVLIPHCTAYKYFGTTMISIPQLSGDPCIMFLYPEHVRGLQSTLGDMEVLRDSISAVAYR